VGELRPPLRDRDAVASSDGRRRPRPPTALGLIERGDASPRRLSDCGEDRGRVREGPRQHLAGSLMARILAHCGGQSSMKRSRSNKERTAEDACFRALLDQFVAGLLYLLFAFGR